MARTPTRRSNAEWTSALGGTGVAAAEAQEELRTLVRGALRKATAGFGSLDEATLDDLTQVALLRILAVLDRFEGRSRFTTWAYSVAVRAAFSELRKAPYRESGGGGDQDLADAEDPRSGDSERSAERQEIVDVLRSVIDRDLTARQQRAVRAQLEGTPTAELARELGTNTNALYKLLHDARARLQRGLAAAGISPAEVREAFDL